MKLLNYLKKYAIVRYSIRSVKKTSAGRALVKRGRLVLGADVRSRTKSPPPVTVSESRRQDFNILRAEFRELGARHDLLSRGRSLIENSVAWGALHPQTWLVYAMAFLEAGDTASAEKTLRRYAARNGVRYLADCLPLAHFARGIGLTTDAISRSADVFSILVANRDKDVFGEFVRGRSVAVVGNGPGNIKSGRGKEIDSHDVVIRFNNYPNDYREDYGSRTDIWVRGAHKDVRDRYDIARYGLVLWEMELFRNILEHPTHTDILFRDTLFFPDKVTFISAETKRGLREDSGLILPTSGAQTIWALKQARGNLDGVDVYGFSGLDGTKDFGHYFDQLSDMSVRHDVQAESAYLRSILSPRSPNSRQVPPVPSAREGVVFSCAYRTYDPSRGKTGGPAGVLATERIALGDEHGGYDLRYVFDDGDKAALRDALKVRTAGLSSKIADIILGGEYIKTHPEILDARREGRNVLLVCHELGSAYGAYQLGIPYIIVFHQQGSTLQEMRSIGRVPSAHEMAAAARLEEIVCSHAVKMYFPSIGAREAFKATSAAGLAGQVNFAEDALYNTVSAVDHASGADEPSTTRASVLRSLALPEKSDDIDVFMSVGDWNQDKGLDRVPQLLEQYVERSGRRVIWIAVGSASSAEQFAAVQRDQHSWGFESRLIGERMKHDRLLELLNYSDYYVMLHRSSIFDLATLEAMRAGKGLILSPVGGNLEVNLADNVVFAEESSFAEVSDAILSRDASVWGRSNRDVFNEHFSLVRFAERYRAMLDEYFIRVSRESEGE